MNSILSCLWYLLLRGLHWMHFYKASEGRMLQGETACRVLCEELKHGNPLIEMWSVMLPGFLLMAIAALVGLGIIIYYGKKELRRKRALVQEYESKTKMLP